MSDYNDQTFPQSEGMNSSTGFPMSQNPTTSTMQGSCASAWSCGQGYSQLQQEVKQLQQTVAKLNETAQEKRDFYRASRNLITVYRIVLIAIPIVFAIAVGSVQYILNETSIWWNILSGAIGILGIAECIILPLTCKKFEERMSTLEASIKNKE